MSDFFSRVEVSRAIEGLSDGTKTALMKIASNHARKTPYDGRDLLNEAITRTLEARRPWPRDRTALEFFGGVIQSIAWEWRVRTLDPQTLHESAFNQEALANASIDFERLLAQFDDDPVAKSLVIAMMQGQRGEELLQLSGLSKTEYESKRTKIRRRIEKFEW